MGRPLKYQDPAKMEAIGNAWLDKQLAEGNPLTITGLGRALGFNDARGDLIAYAAKPKYVHVIKRLRGRVEEWIEQQIHRKQGNVAGAIFAAKNLLNWTDRQGLDFATPTGPIHAKIEVQFAGIKPQDVVVEADKSADK